MAIRPQRVPRAQELKQTMSTHAPVHRRATLRSALRALALGCLATTVGSGTGCSILTNAGKQLADHDFVDEFMIDYRNQAMAAKAWHCQKEKYCNRQHLNEFKEGFYAGYCDIANGGHGCVPAIAPKEYWGWKYQSSAGQGGVNAWFEGYPLGVQAAEVAGVGHWSQIRPAGMPMGPPTTGTPGMMSAPGMMGPGVEIPMDGSVIMGPVMDGGVILESGPQVLMNSPASTNRMAPQASSAPILQGASGAMIQKMSGVLDDGQGAATPAPAVSPGVSDTTRPAVASMSDSDSGQNPPTSVTTSVGDTLGNELPFSFK